MKCKQCGAEMTEWQRSKHVDYLEIRYRCDVCGYEYNTVSCDDKIELDKPKKRIQEAEE